MLTMAGLTSNWYEYHLLILYPFFFFSAKKPVGLTKVKMEDCMRCDACSCIYIDQNDYYKHMRNFHKVNTETEIEIKPPVFLKPVSQYKQSATPVTSFNVDTKSPSKSASRYVSISEQTLHQISSLL